MTDETMAEWLKTASPAEPLSENQKATAGLRLEPNTTLDREAEIARLREALWPFVELAKFNLAEAPEWKDHNTLSIVVTIADLRAALAAYGEIKA